jgi:hypothetical protein
MAEEPVIFKISATSEGVLKAAGDVQALMTALQSAKGRTDYNLFKATPAAAIKSAAGAHKEWVASLKEEATATAALGKVDAAAIGAKAAITAATAKQVQAATQLTSAETIAAAATAKNAQIAASADLAATQANLKRTIAEEQSAAKIQAARAAVEAATARSAQATATADFNAEKIALQRAAVEEQSAAKIVAAKAKVMAAELREAQTANSAQKLAEASVTQRTEAEARALRANNGLFAAQQRQTKLAATGVQKAKVDFGAMGDATGRLASRFEFLGSAIVAGFAFDVISNAANEFVKLEGQLRGLEVTATRAGLAGRRMFDELTQGATGFKFKAQDAADALNKLIVGGLRPAESQVGQAGKVAAGASILFGEDPSKMLNDLATAALRTSYRLADNLGIVIRANETYDKYAASIGKTRMELTAIEKAQAFWDAMLNSSSAKALAAASGIETMAMQFNRAKVALNEFKLALGQQIATSIVSMIQAFGELNSKSIESAARFTVMAAQTAILIIAMGGLSKAIQAVGLAFSSLNKTNIILMALTTIAAAVTFAVDKMNQSFYATQQRLADVSQMGVQFQQFMASMAFAPIEAAAAANELATALNRMGADSQFILYAQQSVESIANYGSALNDMVEKQKDASDEMKALGKSAEEQGKKMSEQAVEAVKSSDTQAEAQSKLRAALEEAGISMGQYAANIAQMISDQNASLVEGLSGWDRFLLGCKQGLAGLADFAMYAADSVSFGVNNILNSAIDGINGFLNALRSIGRMMPNLPGGSSIGIQALAGLPSIAHIKAGGGGAIGLTAHGGGGGSGKGKNGQMTPAEAESLYNFQGPVQFTGVYKYADRAQYEAKLYAATKAHERGTITQAALAQIQGKYGFASDLYPVGATGKGTTGGRGGGGGGGKQKDLYAQGVAKLQEQLKQIELQNQQLAEIYPVTSETRRLEEQKLSRKQDEALLDFEVEARQQGWYDKFVKQEPLLVQQIANAKTRIAAEDAINKKLEEAVKSAQENLSQMQREFDIRKSLGGKVEETELSQKKLDDAIKLAADQSISLAEAMAALNLSAQDVKPALDKMRKDALDAAQKLVDSANQLSQDWDMNQIGYRQKLLAAREADPNRRQGIGFNQTYEEFDRLMQDVDKTKPATEQAMELVKSLQELQIAAEQTAADMQNDKMLRSRGVEVVNQMLADMQMRIDTAMQQLNPEGYVAGQMSQAEAQLVEAQGANTNALGALTSAVYALNGTMGGVGASIANATSSAISSAMSQLNAAVAAAQQAAGPAIAAAITGGGDTSGTAAGATGGGGGGGG